MIKETGIKYDYRYQVAAYGESTAGIFMAPRFKSSSS